MRSGRAGSIVNTMKSSVIIWIVVALIVIAGIFWFMNRPGSDTETFETFEAETSDTETFVAPGPEEPLSLVVTLDEQNDSGMTGSAAITRLNGRTVVELTLVGAPEGVTQPAHIHTGSCADIGGVVYPLTFPVNGASETTLDVSLDDILAGLPLALNVHKSPEEADVYVACGDLTLM